MTRPGAKSIHISLTERACKSPTLFNDVSASKRVTLRVIIRSGADSKGSKGAVTRPSRTTGLHLNRIQVNPQKHSLLRGEENTLLGVHSEAKRTNVMEDNISVTTHLLPGVSHNEPVIQVIQHANALEPQRGQRSIHALRECSRRQGQAKGKDLVLVSLPSKGKLKELPVPPDDLDVKIGILHVDSDKLVPSLNQRHDGFHRQHLELPFVKGKIQTPQVQNGPQAAVSLWNKEVAAEEPSFDVQLRYFLYRSFLYEGGKFLL